MQNTSYENQLKNLKATFAVEGMDVSASTQRNLDRIVLENVPYQTVLEEIRAKYMRVK